MSHFTVLVFSNNGGEDLKELLAPYDENITMEPYIEYTKKQIIEKVRKEIEDYRDHGYYAEYIKDPQKYKELHGDNKKHIDYLENEFPKELNWTDEQCYESEARWYGGDKIDADGNLLSTYNPKSKWDWYSVGGRWSGGLTMIDGTEVNACDVCMIDWLKTPVPFAFVTPDGEWHERGEMGWWATVTNEKEQSGWEDEFRKAIADLVGAYVTLVDCHI